MKTAVSNRPKWNKPRQKKKRPTKPLTPEQADLAAANIKLVYNHLYNFLRKSSYHLDSDVYLSAGMEALCKSARSFKPELGFQFSTYASRAIFLAFSRTFAETKQTIRCEYKLDDDILGIQGSRLYVKEFVRELDLRTSAQSILKLLPSGRWREALQRVFLGGETRKEVAASWGISGEAVRTMVDRAILYLRTHHGDLLMDFEDLLTDN